MKIPMVDMSINLAVGKMKELRMNRAAMDMLNEKRGNILLIESMLEALQESLKKADFRNRNMSDFSVGSWIVEVLCTAHEIEDVIDGVSNQIDRIYLRVEKVSATFVSDVRVSQGPPLPLKNWMLSSDTSYYSWKTSLQKLEDDMIGFDKYFETLKEKLIGGSERREEIHIQGESGIGKTTLAKKVYNSVEIQSHFEVCIWLHLLLILERGDLHVQIRENLLAAGLEVEEESSACSIKTSISNCLQGKRYILVLDDISRRGDCLYICSIFPKGFEGSRVVTIAHPGAGVVWKADSKKLSLGYLSKDDSKRLFCQRAFLSFDWPGDFADISFDDIHDLTEGHPLTILVLSRVLNSQLPPFMWKKILTWLLKSNQGSRVINRNRILSLIFDNLPNHVKTCFLYFAGFFNGTVFCADKLVRLWDAEGFIDIGNGKKALRKLERVFSWS
ncbi:hypothetical protein LUZ60_003947 [Juncus effusus]|nr:hypothetical protein LUZ60_003947 [Juncus effusus]